MKWAVIKQITALFIPQNAENNVMVLKSHPKSDIIYRNEIYKSLRIRIKGCKYDRFTKIKLYPC